MNSGRIVERRDQVLIGRLSLVARTASTLSIRCASTNGPFLRERPISYPLTLMTALNDHAVRALVTTSTITLRRLPPWIDRHTTFAGLALTPTVRVIDRDHRGAANGRAHTPPALSARLTNLAKVILFVANLTDGGTTLNMHATNFAGTQTNLRVDTLASQQLNGRTCRTSYLRPLARQHLDATDSRTDRNVANRQRITRLDRSLRATHNRLPNNHALVGNNVTTLTVSVTNQSDVCCTIWIILKTLNLARNTILGALKINYAIGLLVATTLMADSHTAVVIATGFFRLRLNQSRVRLSLVQVWINNLNNAATARGSWLYFNESHYALPPSTKLISWPGFRLTKAFFQPLRRPTAPRKRLTLPFTLAT